jgi:hypothetical protein
VNATAPLLPDAQPTERDYQAQAWERLVQLRLQHPGLDFDGALKHPVIGKVLRGMAAQAMRQEAEHQRELARRSRYGTPVRYVRVPIHRRKQ